LGEEWSHTGGAGNEEHFTGLKRDPETENDYAQARYYASHHGRWLSPDPKIGQLSNPQSLNRYTYGGSNPVNFTDINGLSYNSNSINSGSVLPSLMGFVPGGIGADDLPPGANDPELFYFSWSSLVNKQPESFYEYSFAPTENPGSLAKSLWYSVIGAKRQLKDELNDKKSKCTQALLGLAKTLNGGNDVDFGSEEWNQFKNKILDALGNSNNFWTLSGTHSVGFETFVDKLGKSAGHVYWNIFTQGNSYPNIPSNSSITFTQAFSVYPDANNIGVNFINAFTFQGDNSNFIVFVMDNPSFALVLHETLHLISITAQVNGTKEMKLTDTALAAAFSDGDTTLISTGIRDACFSEH